MSPDHAAELISQHIPREHRGAIWLRCRKATRVTRGFLRRAERFERIERWRADHGRRNTRQVPVSFEAMDGAEQIQVVLPEFSRTPENLRERLLSCLSSRERLCIEMRTLRENSLVGTGICMGLTDSAVCKMERLAFRKMLRVLRTSFPGLEGERA